MKNNTPMPLGAACTTLPSAELRMLYDAAARLGGVAGAAIRLATLTPWSNPNLERTRLEDVDFDTGVVQTITPDGRGAEIVLGRHALSIVEDVANGNRAGSMLAGGVNISVRLATDPMRKGLLDMQLAAIDERVAGIRWDFDVLRQSVAQRMQIDGVPYSVMLSQCALVPSLPPGRDRDRLLETQRCAADTIAASLRLYADPARPTFYPNLRDPRRGTVKMVVTAGKGCIG